MILKSEIATILGINDSDIDDYVYSWAQKIFYTITGFKETETQKWYRDFMDNDVYYILLPDTDIKSIDSIKFDNEVQDFTAFEDYTLNPDTGFVLFTNGIDKDTFVEIQYTANAHTYTEPDGYLIALLTYKGIAIFTPNKIEIVKSIKIGRYSKTFSDIFKGGGTNALITYLDEEIKRATNIVLGTKDDLTFGVAG